MRANRRKFLATVCRLPASALATALPVRAAQSPSAAPKTSNPAAPPETGLRLLHGFIQPAVQRFHDAAHAMHAAVAHHCAAADAGQNAATQPLLDAWCELALAWSALELLRFGPLVQLNRFERIFFWPDARGVMLRQMQPLLQSAANVPQDLRTHSVALQGLPALETLLVGNAGLATPDAAAHAARCAFARAVTHNLSAMAEELQVAWADNSAYARDFSRPAPENAVYRSENEILTEVLKALSGGLRFEGEVKLRAALGARQDKARARVLPFWRSQLSLLALAESVQALQTWHAAAAFAREPAWLAQSLARELHDSATLLRAQGIQVDHMAQDPEVYQTLRLVVLKLDNARRMVEEDLAPALGVGLGFNALDGD